MQAAKCMELRIPADLIGEDDFSGMAESLSALGTAEETDVDSSLSERIAWFNPDHISADAIQTELSGHGIAADQMNLIELEQQDWETAWQQDWHGMPIGERLWVRPSFCEAATDNRIDIVLDPGMAFGTGTHPTTQLCLEAVERVCADAPPATLLDMGAGSGILAIAALKLGAGDALAIDMEEESVEACKTNAAINGVTLTAVKNDTPPAEQFDLVVANILAAPLVWMAKELAACVGSRLILSGLLVEQVDDVAAAYTAEGLTETRRDTQGDWVSVEFAKK